MKTIAVLVVLLGAVASVAYGFVAADEVMALPGWDAPLPSKHYSGYLNITGQHGVKHLHYYFVEAHTNASTAPVVLWLNGGPGCSSLDGFIYEHGPFRINQSNPEQLIPFEYAWPKVANMIYLEAPVGVGFSYADSVEDLKCDDDTSSQDNLHAMEKFFELYPEYAENDFFITGESYAGIYVPTLAEAIMWAMGNNTYKGAPLKGIAVGNGCAGNSIGVCGGERDKYDTEYLIGTAFVDPALKIEIRSECDFSKDISLKCRTLIAQMHSQIGHINLYNMYGPCISGSEEEKAGSGSNTYKAPMGKSSFQGPDACIDSVLASKYFNRPDVISAIHVHRPEAEWSVCAQQAGWSYSSNRPNLPRDTYPALVKHFRVTIYNGDWDACVPYTDNMAWTEGMGYDVVDPWHPWEYELHFEGTVSEQVGGYAIRYKDNDFTFITVRGGRHEVPETAPDRALAMLERVISETNF